MTGINFKELQSGQILPIIEMSLQASRNKLNRQQRKYCFEIFGYDFMVDCELKTWLIEVNTNPCLEESSPLLKQLIPRMLDDAFKLTLDQVYPALRADQLPEREWTQERFAVDGYADSLNMWGEKFYKLRL